jgi:hypothetical protein
MCSPEPPTDVRLVGVEYGSATERWRNSTRGLVRPPNGGLATVARKDGLKREKEVEVVSDLKVRPPRWRPEGTPLRRVVPFVFNGLQPLFAKYGGMHIPAETTGQSAAYMECMDTNVHTCRCQFVRPLCRRTRRATWTPSTHPSIIAARRRFQVYG